ncbi:Cathepsin_L [Hexamita inflata]|uniref:Cathepsin L n=1 Tax=Hexamita inflata TaxID=28002 RepID=A0AA86S0F8_9EUKA|nr:Cathepsin L [Hexamita inflata]
MLFMFISSVQLDVSSQTCKQAFEQHKKQFNLTYKDEKRHHFDVFCQNYMKLVERHSLDPDFHLDFTPEMDQLNASSSTPTRLETKEEIKYNSVKYPLFVMPTVYASVDLREMKLITTPKQQGFCGSGYAFQTIAMMENAVLRDKSNLNTFWQSYADASTLSLSEQFLMSNSICNGCRYCEGGSFVVEQMLSVPGNSFQQYMIPTPAVISTIELTENFPNDFVVKEAAWKANTQVISKLATENKLLPVKFFPVNKAFPWLWQQTPVVQLFDDDNTRFDAENIRVIKSHLSRGLAVAVQMDIGTGVQAIVFKQFIGGEILHRNCNTFNSNHAVTLVGYGRKCSKEVWVIKNSFGEQWGDKGYFFLEIGKDSFCLEHSAYAIIPKFFNLTNNTPYPKGDSQRGKQFTLDCDYYFTSVNEVTVCYDTCPPEHPVFYTMNNECISTQCPQSSIFKENGSCVSRCSSGAYQFTGIDLLCVSSCADMYLLNNFNQNSKQCITSCPSHAPYYEHGRCVQRCESGAYLVVHGKTQMTCQDYCAFYVLNASNDNSKRCFSQYPPDLPYSESGMCSARCSSGSYSNMKNTKICQNQCTSYHFTNTTNENSLFCLESCIDPYNFVDGIECREWCPFYKQITTTGLFQCVGSCELVDKAQKCVDVCKHNQIVNNKQCVNQSTNKNANIIIIFIIAIGTVFIVILIVVLIIIYGSSNQQDKKIFKQPINTVNNYQLRSKIIQEQPQQNMWQNYSKPINKLQKLNQRDQKVQKIKRIEENNLLFSNTSVMI